MATECRIPVNYVVPLLKLAAEEGCDIEQLARDVELNFNPLEQEASEPEGVTPKTFRKLYLSVSELLQGEITKYRSNCKIPQDSLQTMCYHLVECSTLRSALDKARHFLAGSSTFGGSLPENTELYRLSEDGQRLRLLHSGYCGLPRDAINSSRQLRMVYSLALWHRFCCWLTGQYIEVNSVSLMGPAMLNLTDFRFHFECPILFDRKENAIEVSTEALDLPIAQTKASLLQLLTAGPSALFDIETTQHNHNLAPKMRSLISREQSSDIPKLSEVSEMIDIPVRTLRRHLVKEGSSYQKVKDEYRRDLAIKYLSQPDISITAAAVMMGFEELSAFHRSFKKWTGITPGEFRRRNNIDSR